MLRHDCRPYNTINMYVNNFNTSRYIIRSVGCLVCGHWPAQVWDTCPQLHVSPGSCHSCHLPLPVWDPALVTMSRCGQQREWSALPRSQLVSYHSCSPTQWLMLCSVHWQCCTHTGVLRLLWWTISDLHCSMAALLFPTYVSGKSRNHYNSFNNFNWLLSQAGVVVVSCHSWIIVLFQLQWCWYCQCYQDALEALI